MTKARLGMDPLPRNTPHHRKSVTMDFSTMSTQHLLSSPVVVPLLPSASPGWVLPSPAGLSEGGYTQHNEAPVPAPAIATSATTAAKAVVGEQLARLPPLDVHVSLTTVKPLWLTCYAVLLVDVTIYASGVVTLDVACASLLIFSVWLLYVFTRNPCRPSSTTSA